MFGEVSCPCAEAVLVDIMYDDGETINEYVAEQDDFIKAIKESRYTEAERLMGEFAWCRNRFNFTRCSNDRDQLKN